VRLHGGDPFSIHHGLTQERGQVQLTWPTQGFLGSGVKGTGCERVGEGMGMLRGSARRGVIGVIVGASVAIATLGDAVGQGAEAPAKAASVLAPGISLGMTMRQAARVCRGRGDAVTVDYVSNEGDGGVTLPLGTPSPVGVSIAAIKCEGDLGELWIALSPASVPPRLLVTEVWGYLRPSGLGMAAHEYAREITRRHGTPTFDQVRRGPGTRSTLQWVLPLPGARCMPRDIHADEAHPPCASLLTLTFLAQARNADAVSIGFGLSQLRDQESVQAALGDSEWRAPSTSASSAATGPDRVFGITLSAVGRFTGCGDTATSVLLATGVPCFPREAELDGPWDVRSYRPADEIFLGDSGVAPPRVRFHPLRLAEEHCPSWLHRDCLLSVATLSNLSETRVVGLAFRTASVASEPQIREQLRAMFGPEVGEGTPITCRNRDDTRLPLVSSTQRQWTTPHLRVEYGPVSGTPCDAGVVRIQDASLVEAFASASR